MRLVGRWSMITGCLWQRGVGRGLRHCWWRLRRDYQSARQIVTSSPQRRKSWRGIDQWGSEFVTRKRCHGQLWPGGRIQRSRPAEMRRKVPSSLRCGVGQTSAARPSMFGPKGPGHPRWGNRSGSNCRRVAPRFPWQPASRL